MTAHLKIVDLRKVGIYVVTFNSLTQKESMIVGFDIRKGRGLRKFFGALEFLGQ